MGGSKDFKGVVFHNVYRHGVDCGTTPKLDLQSVKFLISLIKFFYSMAQNFGHLSPHSSSGFSQSMTKMAYENYKASYEKDGIFLKILERLQTFFSLPESSKIESIQRYFRCIIYRAKMISIPFFRNDFNSHLRGQWKHNKSLTKTSKITYLIWNNQKKRILHDLPKSSQNIDLETPRGK